VTYTAHYLLEDFRCFGRVNGAYTGAVAGISIQNNVGDISVVRPYIRGFPIGIKIEAPSNDPLYYDRGLIFVGVDTDSSVAQKFTGLNATADLVLTSDQVVAGRFDLSFDQNPATFKEGHTDPEGRRVRVSGTKTDSAGPVSIPPPGDTGPDNYDGLYSEAIRRLETAGYYTDSNGDKWFVLPDFYTDRVSGEIHQVGRLVQINDNVPLGNQFFAFKGAIDRGTISIPNNAPTARDDETQTFVNTDVTIAVLTNDADSDGDSLSVDGIVEPDYGVAYPNQDGTITFRPDRDFEGATEFRYWVTDAHGNYKAAKVTVTVVQRSASLGGIGSTISASLSLLTITTLFLLALL